MTRKLASVGVAVVFAAVLGFFLFYSHQMEEALRRDAAVFGRMYANAVVGVSADDAARRREVLSNILEESLQLQVPIVLTDTAGRPTSAANLPFEFDPDERESMRRTRRYLEELDERIEPYRVPEFNVSIHYGEPPFLARFRWMPWLTAAVLLAALGGGGWMIYTSFRGERERIWSAMARESAHQMGTPLSSLVGWLEQLETRGGPAAAGGAGEGAEPGGGRGGPDLVREMKADVDRLLKVSRRFELIGRNPDLEPVSVREVLCRLEDYFSVRLPTLGSAVDFRLAVPESAPAVRGNETLVEWAFENLIKNSLDALAGQEGEIRIDYVGTRGGSAAFRVADTGPGVEPRVRKRLFEIGVTTKERGWGVGLSLTRRIVEEMHEGEIELEPTTDGASFLVELPVASGEPA